MDQHTYLFIQMSYFLTIMVTYLWLEEFGRDHRLNFIIFQRLSTWWVHQQIDQKWKTLMDRLVPCSLGIACSLGVIVVGPIETRLRIERIPDYHIYFAAFLLIIWFLSLLVWKLSPPLLYQQPLYFSLPLVSLAILIGGKTSLYLLGLAGCFLLVPTILLGVFRWYQETSETSVILGDSFRLFVVRFTLLLAYVAIDGAIIHVANSAYTDIVTRFLH